MRVFFTTKRLLGITEMGSHHVNSDATYKMNFQGYPVLMNGTTDRSKAFHPYGLWLTLTENHEDYAFVYEGIKKGAEQLNLKDFKVIKI
jgi:hypothetical protein